jgi:hypothetical protein
MSTPNEAEPDMSGPSQPPTQPQQPSSTHGPVILLQTSTVSHDPLRKVLSNAGFEEGVHFIITDSIAGAESYVSISGTQLFMIGTIQSSVHDSIAFAASLKQGNPLILTGWLSSFMLSEADRCHFDFVVNPGPDGPKRLVELVRQFHSQHE